MMVPEYVGWRFRAESDRAGQIYGATLVHVQIWPAQDRGRGNCEEEENKKLNTKIQSL